MLSAHFTQTIRVFSFFRPLLLNNTYGPSRERASASHRWSVRVLAFLALFLARFDKFLQRMKRLLEIVLEIFNVLDARRKPDHVPGDAGARAIGIADLLMRCAVGM